MALSDHYWDRLFAVPHEPHQPFRFWAVAANMNCSFALRRPRSRTLRSRIRLRSSENKASILFRARRAIALGGLRFKGRGRTAQTGVLRSCKYLNNLIEQDHRRTKQRLRPMSGLKNFRTARVLIDGIELAKRIKKGQFKIGKLGGSAATMPEICP